MRPLVLQGEGPSPRRLLGCLTLRTFGDVDVSSFDLSVEEGVERVLLKGFDLIEGHSRGGTVTLLSGAKKDGRVTACSSPTDKKLQLEHVFSMRHHPLHETLRLLVLYPPCKYSGRPHLLPTLLN